MQGQRLRCTGRDSVWNCLRQLWVATKGHEKARMNTEIQATDSTDQHRLIQSVLRIFRAFSCDLVANPF